MPDSFLIFIELKELKGNNLLSKMRPQHGPNYLRRSHGVKLLRYHMHDWIMIMGLLVLEIILTGIHPFYRFVGKDMMTDLRYPFKSKNTVPLWSVPVCIQIPNLESIFFRFPFQMIQFLFIISNAYGLTS